jgi:hypothetical protein
VNSQNKIASRNLIAHKTKLAFPRRGAHDLAKGCGAMPVADASSGDRGAKFARYKSTLGHWFIVNRLRRQRSLLFPVDGKVLNSDQESDIDRSASINDYTTTILKIAETDSRCASQLFPKFHIKLYPP